MSYYNHLKLETDSINSVTDSIRYADPQNKKFIIPAVIIGIIIISKFILLFIHYNSFKSYDFTGISTTYFQIAMVVLCLFLLKCILVVINFKDYGINNKQTFALSIICFVLCIISTIVLNYIAHVEDSEAIKFYNEVQESVENNTKKQKNKFEEMYYKTETLKEKQSENKFYELKLVVADRVQNSNILSTRLYMNFVTLKYYYHSYFDGDPMYYYGFLNLFSKIYLVGGIYFSFTKKRELKDIQKTP